MASLFNTCLVSGCEKRQFKACSHGSGGVQGGVVLYLPVLKKFLSSHATLATWDGVQNAITQSLSTHINKELAFVFLVCPDEVSFGFNVIVAAKTV